tara:strand:+ start:613 stop:984 length:372 start_codon:yes stop_codon:yes gene_type:complete
MALGDNIAFFNETTFGLGDEQTTTTGVTGIKVSDSSTAKVLFTKEDTLNSSTISTSAKIDDVVYHLDIDTAYNGKELAVINGDRLSTQFTFDSSLSSAFQTASAQGNNSVGPTLRRLYHLGYV